MALPKISMDHFGIHVTDLDNMSDFYMRVLGFVQTDGGIASTGIGIRFFTRDVKSHHQFVLASGRPDGSYNMVNQISLCLETLDDLRAYDEIIKNESQATKLIYIDHGISWSLYFDDPEGNWVELTVNSPFFSPQPFRDDLDLSMSDEEIIALTEQRCRAKPGFSTREEWQAMVQKKLDATNA